MHLLIEFNPPLQIRNNISNFKTFIFRNNSENG